MTMTTSKFRRYVRRCRDIYPLDAPVTVRRTARQVDGDACAMTSVRGGRILITIWRGQCQQAIVDSLLHEWTHALLYDGGASDDVWMSHGPEFWSAFGEVYRAWTG